MPRPAAVPVLQQLEAVADAATRAADDLAEAKARYDVEAIERLRRDVSGLRAAQVTLAWLAKDREGCVQLLTSRWS